MLQAYGGNIDALFAETIRQNPSLIRRFAKARRTGAWLASPLPRFGVARVWPAGVIPLGNAAAALEPIGGEGMGLAMRSAELAAAALVEGSGSERLRAAFDALWQSRRLACRAAAMVVSRPGLSGAALDWVRGNERLAAAAMRFIGKAG